jgi:hypothetical protein
MAVSLGGNQNPVMYKPKPTSLAHGGNTFNFCGELQKKLDLNLLEEEARNKRHNCS